MSINLNVYNQKGEKVGDLNLSESVFGLEANENLIHQTMVTQMSNERQVLAHTKQRAEVRGGGRKPWRQKGTGRARAGTNRSPIWVGGGITFGPTKFRNFKKKINKKMKQKATLMVLSDKAKHNKLVVLDKIKLEEFKTKIMDQILKTVEQKILQKKDEEKRSSLIVLPKTDEKVKKSGSNLVGVKIINSDNINILDLLNYKNVVFVQDVVKDLEEKHKVK